VFGLFDSPIEVTAVPKVLVLLSSPALLFYCTEGIPAYNPMSHFTIPSAADDDERPVARIGSRHRRSSRPKYRSAFVRSRTSHPSTPLPYDILLRLLPVLSLHSRSLSLDPPPRRSIRYTISVSHFPRSLSVFRSSAFATLTLRTPHIPTSTPYPRPLLAAFAPP
jgi:hypothetical protein